MSCFSTFWRMLLFPQCSLLTIYPLTATGACFSVSYLHPVKCHNGHCKDISGAEGVIASFDDLTWYQITMAKISTFEQ